MSGQKLSLIGRAILAVLFALISIFNFIRIDSVSHSASDTLRPFIIQSFILLLALFSVYYLVGQSKKYLMKK